MATAFKCDVCNVYYDGYPYLLTIIPSKLTCKSKELEICHDCILEITKPIRNRVYIDGL